MWPTESISTECLNSPLLFEDKSKNWNSSLLFTSRLFSKYLFDKATIKSIRTRVLFQTSDPRIVFFCSRRLKMRRHRQIALLGFPGVGKSSLAHHFVYKNYSNEYDPNIKTSLSRPRSFIRSSRDLLLLDLQHQCIIANVPYDLLIVDNAGSDQYSINHSDFDNSDAYILVYAIDDRQRFDSLTSARIVVPLRFQFWDGCQDPREDSLHQCYAAVRFLRSSQIDSETSLFSL